MDDGLKQRVIGAVVLISAAVIIIPNIFDRPVEGPRLPPIHIPAVPTMPPIEPLVVPSDDRQVDINKQIDDERHELATESTTELEDELIVSEPVANPEEVKIDTAPTVDKVATTQPTSAVPKNAQRHLEASWLIQLGSFSETKNAQALVERLQQQGFNAYSEKSNSGNGVIVRVFVGPELKKEKAMLIKKQLEDQFKLTGLLKKFVP